MSNGQPAAALLLLCPPSHTFYTTTTGASRWAPNVCPYPLSAIRVVAMGAWASSCLFHHQGPECGWASQAGEAVPGH